MALKFKVGDTVRFKSGYGFKSKERAVVIGYRKTTMRYELAMTKGPNTGTIDSAPAKWLIRTK